MPEFEFTITHDATMSATVKVKANTIEAAQEIAQRPSFYTDPKNGVKWELDEGNAIRDVYLPDEDDYQITPGTENDFSEEYEGDLGNVVPGM